MTGPLDGVRVIEMGSIGPVPFCAMLLADMGAEVIRVDRADSQSNQLPHRRGELRHNIMLRGRRRIAVDIRSEEGRDILLSLTAESDVLLEGFRPGVMERLGLGPDDCHEQNPALIYGRMTGWGRDGPLSDLAGHDVNYIAVAGVLGHLGDPGRPPRPPLNLVGDYGGGAMYLAMGVLAALVEARSSCRGQVVDAAMVDGAASLMSSFWGADQAGKWATERGSNIVDGGAPFYNVYECSDGHHIAIGAVEPKFYDELLDRLGLDLGDQYDTGRWAQQKTELEGVFRSRSRDEWCDLLQEHDVCFSPVLTMQESMEHEHNRSRGVYIELDGVHQPGPAPRFSRTESRVTSGPRPEGSDTWSTLVALGYPDHDIRRLMADGVVHGDDVNPAPGRVHPNESIEHAVTTDPSRDRIQARVRR